MEKKIYYLNPVFEAKYWGGQALRGRYGCLLLLCIRTLRAVNTQTCPNGYNLQIYMLTNCRVHRNMILRNCAA